LAAALKSEPDVKVELVNGDHGELTVLLDGRIVAKKGFFSTPTVEKVLAAVREAEPAATSH
jgi:hypothetical protein